MYVHVHAQFSHIVTILYKPFGLSSQPFVDIMYSYGQHTLFINCHLTAQQRFLGDKFLQSASEDRLTRNLLVHAATAGRTEWEFGTLNCTYLTIRDLHVTFSLLFGTHIIKLPIYIFYSHTNFPNFASVCSSFTLIIVHLATQYDIHSGKIQTFISLSQTLSPSPSIFE